jgi:hypothetical protein
LLVSPLTVHPKFERRRWDRRQLSWTNGWTSLDWIMDYQQFSILKFSKLNWIALNWIELLCCSEVWTELNCSEVWALRCSV